MLRKSFFVAVPLLLTATLGFVFWRVHHPPMSEQDVELQRFISSHPAHVYLYSTARQPAPPLGVVGTDVVNRVCIGFLNVSEMSSVAGQSYVGDMPEMNTGFDSRYSVQVEFDQPLDKGQHLFLIQLGLKERTGEVSTYGEQKMKRAQMLYPLSTQAWTRFLLNHPRVGPAIRHRLGMK